MKRRDFLKTAALSGTTAGLLGQIETQAAEKSDSNQAQQKLHVAISQYYLHTFYGRDGIDFKTRIARLKEFGADGVEPTAGSVDWLETFCPLLKDNGLECRSIYIDGNLHEESKAEQEIVRLLKIIETGRKFGAKLAIFNPAAKHGKTDAELQCQSRNADRLGEKAKQLGARLLFHYHTTELEFGGREFHHLLCNTNPEFFGYCLEQLWSFRGCGHSQLALFDHIKLYGTKIEAVHLRQTRNNILCESFEGGDMDNSRLARELKKLPQSREALPHLLIEQSPDPNTEKTISADESIRRSIAYVRRTFSL